ncbi:MAG TPA: hypothetical protein VGG97_26660 [Bryobacteraceae bacterium]
MPGSVYGNRGAVVSAATKLSYAGTEAELRIYGAMVQGKFYRVHGEAANFSASRLLAISIVDTLVSCGIVFFILIIIIVVFLIHFFVIEVIEVANAVGLEAAVFVRAQKERVEFGRPL